MISGYGKTTFQSLIKIIEGVKQIMTISQKPKDNGKRQTTIEKRFSIPYNYLGK